MDRSYPYTRRVIQRARRQKRVAIVVAAGIASCAILYAAFKPAPLDEPRQPHALHSTLALASNTGAMAPAAPAPRRIYPYSIVPGGVSGPAELARVIRTDRVVAAHYATFDVAHAQEKTVSTPRAVHVSYRKGDKVFWTAKKVMLAEGETLLSDGSHETRARCANRISDTPQYPVEANAPSAEELDSSVLADQPAAGSMEKVAFAMPGGEAAGRGGALHAPGTGSGGGGAATAGGGGNADSFLMAAAAPAGLQLTHGGTLSAGSSGASGSTGTRPAPGTTAPGAGTPASTAPAAPAAGTGGTPQTPGAGATPVASLPGALPAVPGDSPVTTPAPQPDSGLPAPPAGQVTTPGASLPGTTPGASLPVTTPGGVLPGTTPTPVPGGGATILPGDLSGGGDNNVTQPLPAAPGTGSGTPTADTPDHSTVPGPTLTPPAAPPQPRPDAAKPTPIPEPGTLWLVGAALAGMLMRRRRRAPAGR